MGPTTERFHCNTYSAVQNICTVLREQVLLSISCIIWNTWIQQSCVFVLVLCFSIISGQNVVFVSWVMEYQFIVPCNVLYFMAIFVQFSNLWQHGVLVWWASPFPSIAQHRIREKVWYNCYMGFVQDLTGHLQSDFRMRKSSCVMHTLKRNNSYEWQQRRVSGADYSCS